MSLQRARQERHVRVAQSLGDHCNGYALLDHASRFRGSAHLKVRVRRHPHVALEGVSEGKATEASESRQILQARLLPKIVPQVLARRTHPGVGHGVAPAQQGRRFHTAQQQQPHETSLTTLELQAIRALRGASHEPLERSRNLFRWCLVRRPEMGCPSQPELACSPLDLEGIKTDDIERRFAVDLRRYVVITGFEQHQFSRAGAVRATALVADANATQRAVQQADFELDVIFGPAAICAAP